MNEKVLRAAELLVAAIKESMASAPAAAAPRGNRTPARTDYRGGNVVQDLVDCVRRTLRVEREGGELTAKDRNIMKRTIKAAKANSSFGVINTNGVDVFTHARR